MKPKWQDQVKEVDYLYRKNSYTIRELAEHLHISAGKVCQDLKLAAALKVYPRLEEIKFNRDALEYLKKKNFERVEQ